MKPSTTIRFLSPEPGTSFDRFFLETLSEVGSTNLVLALSSDPATGEMLESLRRITRGLLVLNAVYYESECLRFLGKEETESFQKKWGIPVKWLRMGTGRNGSWKADGQPVPPYLLKSLLLSHNMTCLLAADPRVFAWAEMAPVDADLVGGGKTVPAMAHAI
jgi:hypothetical protein